MRQEVNVPRIWSEGLRNGGILCNMVLKNSSAILVLDADLRSSVVYVSCPHVVCCFHHPPHSFCDEHFEDKSSKEEYSEDESSRDLFLLFVWVCASKNSSIPPRDKSVKYLMTL
jgi:hypothetical protein